MKKLLLKMKNIPSSTLTFIGSTWAMSATLIIILRVIRIQFQTVAFGLLGKYVYVSFPGNDLRHLAEDRTLNIHCWYDRKCLASLRGNQKYIYHFGLRPDEFYDLKSDPLEKNDLINTTDVEDWKLNALRWRAGVNQIYRKHQEKNLAK